MVSHLNRRQRRQGSIQNVFVMGVSKGVCLSEGFNPAKLDITSKSKDVR